MSTRASVQTTAILFALASYATAQFSGSSHGNGGDNPYDQDGGSDNPYGDSSSNAFYSNRTIILTAHAVLATVAFGFLFPLGGILIRVCSFRGLWFVHGLIQLFAWILYIAAFGLGILMATHMGAMHNAHPIIGVVLFLLLLFQPILGFLHHYMFRKHSRRVVWSYGHIWLGRIVITLGIVNGGLGLQLAQRMRFFAPPKGAVIGYAVVAGLMWVLYVLAAIYGERERGRTQQTSERPHRYKSTASSEIEAGDMQYDGGNYEMERKPGQRYA